MKKKNYHIGVFGSSVSDEVVPRVRALGKTLGKHKAIVITGACSGSPYMAAHEAWRNGSKVWGFSPELSLARQRKFTPHDDLRIYTKLIYIPKNFSLRRHERVAKKYRNVMSTASCDAGIIIAGRWGSMNEFTNLFDMGKVIGVLQKTGGIADQLESLSKKIEKPGNAIVIYDSSPARLVTRIYRQLAKRDKRKQS